MTVVSIRKTSIASLLIFAAASPFVFASSARTAPPPPVSLNSNLGVIKGIVRDQAGGPIADATVAIFRVGTSKLLKQVRSATDGSFVARIIPGTYTVLAVAEGFNPITVNQIEVSRSAELSYGFKLERAGGGNTLPEKRLDRNNPKWAIRAAQVGRSIYQNNDGAVPQDEVAENVEVIPDADAVPDEKGRRDSQTVVETYFAAASSSPLPSPKLTLGIRINSWQSVTTSASSSSRRAGVSSMG